MSTPNFDLRLDAHGRLVLTLADGAVHEGITPVRAFPLAAPQEGVSLVGSDGHELLWIENLGALAPEPRGLIEQALAPRELVPQITQLHSVSSFATPSTWRVSTDRGETELVLKGEEDIRRISGRTHLLIASASGVQFRVSDLGALDKHSRKLLERFL